MRFIIILISILSFPMISAIAKPTDGLLALRDTTVIDTVFLNIPISDISLLKSDSLEFQLQDSSFYAKSGKALKYEAFLYTNDTINPLPSWVTILSDSNTFRGSIIPFGIKSGRYRFILKASSENSFASDTINIDVVNVAPRLVTPLVGFVLQQGFRSIQVDISKTFISTDGDSLRYSISNSAESIASVSLTDSLITINEVANGQSEIRLTVNDDDGGESTEAFTVIIREIDKAFTFTTENTGSNGLIDSHIRSIHIENNDDIWIGTDNGLSKHNPNNGTWHSELKNGERDSNKIQSIQKLPNGDKILLVERGFWLSQSNSLKYYAGSSAENVIPELGDFLIAGAVGSDNKFWAAVNVNRKIRLIQIDMSTLTVTVDVPLVDQNTPFISMTLDAQNTPWMGTEVGLVHYNSSNQLVIYDQQNGLKENVVTDVEYNNGKVYAAVRDGISVFDGSSFTFISNPDFYQNDTKLYFDKIGDLWVTSNGVIFQYNQTEGWKSKAIDFLGSNWGFGYSISDIKVDDQERVWVASRWGLLKFTDSNAVFTSNPVVYNTFDGLPANDVFEIIKDDLGNLYFPTERNGMSKYDGKSWTWTYQTLPFYSSIWLQNTTAAYVTRNGSIWLGGAGAISATKDGGLTWKSYLSNIYTAGQVEENENIIYNALNMANVLAITEDAGNNLWVGGVHWEIDQVGLNKFDGNTWSVLKVEDGLKSGFIQSLYGTSNGDVWVAYADNLSELTRISASGQMTHFTEIDNSRVTQILEDDAGKIWFATDSRGIKIYDNGTWSNFDNQNGLLDGSVSNMVRDGLGNIWISYFPRFALGVSVYNGEIWQHFNKEFGGLPSDQINSLQVLVTSAGNVGGRIKGEKVAGSLFMGTESDGVGQIDIASLLKNRITSIESRKEELALKLYPNPTEDQVYLMGAFDPIANLIIVYDLIGNILYEADHTGDKIININTTQFKSGTYIVQWNSVNGIQKNRFIKR